MKKAILANLRRRKLPAAVILMVVALSSFAGTLALSLLVEVNGPFDRAFEQARGAHLMIDFDPRQVSPSQVAATANVSLVSASSGPYRQLGVPVSLGSGEEFLALQARERPDTAVDRVQLSQGRWVRQTGEVVVSSQLASQNSLMVGSTLTADATTGIPPLTVVGIGVGVADQVDGWVEPAQLPASITLKVVPGKPAPGDSGQLVMYYRLHSASTDAQITAAATRIARMVPTGSITGTQNWLDFKRNAAITEAVMVPFLLALSVLALVASALIIANVVTGAVIAGRRDLGIMKSIGFTPAQLTTVHLAQVLVPAIFGCLAGLPLGVLASQPLIADASKAFGLPDSFTVAPEIDALWLAAVVAIVAIAALIPAVRAGQIPAARVISDAVSPKRDGSAVANTILARLPLGRSATLGGALTFARPLRSLVTVVAVMLGVASVTFAIGLQQSLSMVKLGLLRTQQVQVQVSASGSVSDATLTDLIQQQPGTARYVSEHQSQVAIRELGQPVAFYAYRGDSSWLGYPLIAGRWFRGSGEAVAPTALLVAAGLHLGETTVVTERGKSIDVRIVGEILDQTNDNLLLRADWATLSQLEPSAEANQYEVQLTRGTNPDKWVRALASAAPQFALYAQTTSNSDADSSFFLIEFVVSALALVLAAIATAGVFNTVLLTTREKVRDIAILKAIGMSPLQTVVVVLSSVVLLGALGGLIGIPAGIALHREILSTMAQIASKTLLPASFYSVFTAPLLAAMVLAGVGVALAGAYLPGQWAARSRVAGVLHAE
jgi:putative ABC transport system permease protein